LDLHFALLSASPNTGKVAGLMSDRGRALTYTLSDRMKDYEYDARLELPRKAFSVIRVDGRSFHTWTRGLERPYSERLLRAMAAATEALCREVSGSVLGYTQSDEISIVYQDFVGKHAEPWFGGVVQKVASVSASIATATFAQEFPDRPLAHFDARVFSLPTTSEAANYLVWRQRDAQKNAISMLADQHYSHRELLGKNVEERIALLRDKGVVLREENMRFLYGQVAYRDTVIEKMSYRDRRTGAVKETPEPVERHPWVCAAAEEFTAAPDNWLAGQLPDKGE
jgi:tRNA(His) 5'-end guanylyltransferase